MRSIWLIILNVCVIPLFAQNITWPTVRTEMKPAARWWWMGSSVNKDGLTYNMEQYAAKGIGGLEITPIYGVKGNDLNEIQYLSPQWMDMLRHTEEEGKRLDINIDMSTGTGWPFGGPHIGYEDAATKVFFQEYKLNKGESIKEPIKIKNIEQQEAAELSCLMAFSRCGRKLDLTDFLREDRLNWTAPSDNWHVIAVFIGKTFQKVKRSAPGGEGYVIDHFSRKSVAKYLDRVTQAFKESKVQVPNSFFNDSYEAYKADWTPDLFEEFKKRRGYGLEEFLPEFIAETRTDTTARIISDYRETLGELLLENFTSQWTFWAHDMGSTTRNQAHGSPANLIDIYSAVDIPECETFGISDFHIKGLRIDSIRKINDSDLSMLKYASSAAHITGKTLVSAEAFTWLTEHFRTSLSQFKPDLDLLFAAGVNHIFIHGITYSPKEAVWPGWKFYASVDMSPTNTIWRDSKPFFDYVTRCQSVLQEGNPDADFLLYFPIYDMWHKEEGRLLMFDIHKMDRRAPAFINAVNQIISSGYDVDYISDRYIKTTEIKDDLLYTEGGISYKGIIVPAVHLMPTGTLAHLLELAKNGATIIFINHYPMDVPGLNDLESRRVLLKELLSTLPKDKVGDSTISKDYGKGRIIVGNDYSSVLQMSGVIKEEMRTKHDLHYIRRKNESGHHYFVSALKEDSTESWITLAVDGQEVMIFNPIDGTSGLARSRCVDGKLQVYLKLKSGESIILKVFDRKLRGPIRRWEYWQEDFSRVSVIDKGWNLRFSESIPAITKTYNLSGLMPWTSLEGVDLKRNMGTGVYSTVFHLQKEDADDWLLDLGDVRESAHVRINGKDVATLWSVPFEVKVGGYLKNGENKIEIEVTNLPANRIADYDRRKVNWRTFKDINFVKLNYKKGDFSHWGIVPSGLLGDVKLIPLKREK
ncbi:MAG: glycosyl hydrolase family 2 [Bacteroidales bacterium]|nr:glycosyl hydrolase family 2 [Bacteroidales bacterium]